jgi:hypothetical protein
MEKVDLTQIAEDGGFTVKLAGPSDLIAADTLSETVTGFKESIRAINTAIAPHSRLEVYVATITPGSVNIGFRLKQLRQHLRRNAKTYATGTAALAMSAIPFPPFNIIVGLLTSFLYDQIKPQEECVVDVGDDNVTIRGRNFQVTVRRQVYELKARIEHDPEVVEGIERSLAAAKKDPAVGALGVCVRPDVSPAVVVPREQFDEVLGNLAKAKSFARARSATTTEQTPIASHQTREQKMRTNLTVIKGGLQQRRSKWGFSWQGVPITASIADVSFMAQLLTQEVAHRLGILDFKDDFQAQLRNPSVKLQLADELDADLSITQRFHADAKAWVNHAYTVKKVYGFKRGNITIDVVSPIKSTDPALSAAPTLAPMVG